VHPPEKQMNAPVLARLEVSEAETIVMDGLDQEGKRKAWRSDG